MTQTLIQSVQRAMRVVECVAAQNQPISAKQIARLTKLEISTVYHLLRTLLHDGYLAKNNAGDYYLGPRLTAVTSSKHQSSLAVTARPILDSLSVHTGCSTFLSLYKDGQLNLVEMVEHPTAQKVDLWVQLEDAAHATALGKATLATLPKDEYSDYLSAHKLQALTENTIVNLGEFEQALKTCHEFALDLGEYSKGVQCVARAEYLPLSAESISIGISGENAMNDSSKRALKLAMDHLVRTLEFSSVG